MDRVGGCPVGKIKKRQQPYSRVCVIFIAYNVYSDNMEKRDELTLLKERIDEADAMVIGGSSAMSAASGYMDTKNADEYPEKEPVERMKNKLLLIIDPQIDFITGTLPVPGAVAAMDSLAEYIRMNSADYSGIIVTADRHPMRHCSFKSEGGEWPAHCVADSVGAAIWPAVMDSLMAVTDKVTVLHKGEDPDKEEYSILKNETAVKRISAVVDGDNIGQIDICGLAGDVCVADTIRDWFAADSDARLNVLKEFTPSIDGGKALDSLISKHGLSCAR
jgi:hypothetical protein BACCOPRO_01378